MDARIVKDLSLSDINRQIEILRERGVFVMLYQRLISRANKMGYTEDEVKRAIIELRKSKEIMTGKFKDGTGWLRDYRKLDEIDDLRPK